MPQLQGKQIASQSITSTQIANNTITSGQVDSSIIIAAGTNPLTGDWNVGGYKLTGLADPISAGDAATKNYVDATAQGLQVKSAVVTATTGALPSNTRTGNVLTATANGALSAIDGITNVLNDRILVKNEATPANNGIYYLSQQGTVSLPWQLTRTTDANTSAEVMSGMFCFVEEGTVNADSGWVLSTPNPITLNTTALTFVQFSGAGSITAGNGLNKVGNTLNVVIGATSAGLVANPGEIDINWTLSGTLANIDAGAASAGSSQTIPYGDHKHSVNTGTAGAAHIGDAASAGTATTLARSDHQHSVASAAPVSGAVAVGNAASAGSAATFAGSDHVHAVARGTPVAGAVVVGGTAAGGSAATFAASDHIHAVVSAAPVTTSVQVGNAAAAGSAATFSASDHQHAVASGTPVTGAVQIGSTAAPGSAATFAASDHVHTVTSAAPVASAVQVGNAASAGSATTFAGSDHVHSVSRGTPVSGAVVIGGVASGGTALTFAAADHIHGVLSAAPPTTAVQVGNASSAGAAATFAASDHQHAVASAAPPAGAVAVGNSAAAGSALTFSASDHQHAVSAATPVNAGSANAAGSATTFVRSDHVHAVPRSVASNKAMTGSVTSSNGDQATSTTVAFANALSGNFAIFVNGLSVTVGNGTKTGVESYVSGDGGATARAFSAIAAGDTLRWNGTVAGYQLAATDLLDCVYDSF